MLYYELQVCKVKIDQNGHFDKQLALEKIDERI